MIRTQLSMLEQQEGRSAIDVVLDEINYLEGFRPRSAFKKEAPFRGGLLDGLMHKHFFSAASLPVNLRNYWLKDDRVEQVLSRIAKQHETTILTEEVLADFRKRLFWPVLDHKEAEGSLTGNWLVYVRYQEKNYYLCCAQHSEAEVSIHRRFYSAALHEFPELPIRAEA